jgi:hypothetical protein
MKTSARKAPIRRKPVDAELGKKRRPGKPPEDALRPSRRNTRIKTGSFSSI